MTKTWNLLGYRDISDQTGTFIVQVYLSADTTITKIFFQRNVLFWTFKRYRHCFRFVNKIKCWKAFYLNHHQSGFYMWVNKGYCILTKTAWQNCKRFRNVCIFHLKIRNFCLMDIINVAVQSVAFINKFEYIVLNIKISCSLSFAFQSIYHGTRIIVCAVILSF